ncbi:MAG: hypothetical protein HY868_13545 [Chloroflexi bacterium]|nr:hypothetical protein [Chloroflexota bacterium]
MENEILWTSGFINERLPAPISPLGWSHIGPFVEELALREPLRWLGYPHAETIPLTRLWRGHPYANVRAFQIFYKCFPDFLLPEDAYRYFPDGDVSARKTAPYPSSIYSPRFLVSIVRAFARDWQNFSTLHNYRVWARYTREHDARVADLRARLPALRDADPHAIFDALRDTERAHRGVLRIHRWSLTHADLTFGLLKRIAGEDAEYAARALADVPNKTLEVDADLRQLSRAQFLAKHGHRSFSLDIAAPTFAEDPAQVERLMTTADDRLPTTDTQDKSRSAIGGLRSFGVKAILPLARRYVALREDQRYYWQKSLAAARQLYLLLADRLVAHGVIAERGTIFFATHDELLKYFDDELPKTDLARMIAMRQAEWRAYQREFEESPTASYPAFLRGDVPLERVGATLVVAQPHQWRGRAISPGIARGVARVVRSANELARVQRGEILVAPATDPGWTPVFARIAGLVVERGGVLSHSAVVAREYRVPGVAGIPGIVDEIREGETIQVDGSSGAVKVVQ